MSPLIKQLFLITLAKHPIIGARVGGNYILKHTNVTFKDNRLGNVYYQNTVREHFPSHFRSHGFVICNPREQERAKRSLTYWFTRFFSFQWTVFSCQKKN